MNRKMDYSVVKAQRGAWYWVVDADGLTIDGGHDLYPTKKSAKADMLHYLQGVADGRIPQRSDKHDFGSRVTVSEAVELLGRDALASRRPR